MAVLRGLDPNRVSTVLGWHAARVPLTTADLLSLPPAVIVNVSMHGFVLSAAAAAWLRDDEAELVTHQQDAEWAERHLPTLLTFFGRMAGLTADKIDRYLTRMSALGLGVIDDMLMPGLPELDLIAGSRIGREVACWTRPEVYHALPEDRQARVTGLKYFTDGALGARTAALRGRFLDGCSGLLLMEDETLRRTLVDGVATGKALAIHAIGDRAIEQVLRVLGGLSRDGVRLPVIRLEHVQLIDETQARRARDLGLTLSMQPNFNSDSVDYADRLDTAGLAANNPFRMLIDRVGFVPGRDLVFGSDGMPHGVEYALQWSLFPAYPGQRLSVDEVIAGYGPAASRGGVDVEVDEARRQVRVVGVLPSA